MIRFFIAILFLSTLLFSYSHDDIIKDYQAEKYKEVCIKSAPFYKNGGKNENMLSIIGDACAKVDFINPLGYIVRGLVSTPQFRENGSYFATLLLQKKLIYQFMNDNIDLKNIRLPRSEHTLSIIFENLAKNNYKKEDGKIKIKADTKEYLIWLGNDEKKVVHVDEYVDGKRIKRHWYL